MIYKKVKDNEHLITIILHCMAEKTAQKRGSTVFQFVGHSKQFMDVQTFCLDINGHPYDLNSLGDI